MTTHRTGTREEWLAARLDLLVYHFMFGPDYKAGYPPCSAIANGYNGSLAHLAHHDVMLWTVSRAPLDKLRAYKQRMDGLPQLRQTRGPHTSVCQVCKPSSRE